MTQPDNTIDTQGGLETPAERQEVGTSQVANRIKPIDGQLVGQMWENDQRVLFELAAKLNEVIAAVNDLLATDDPSQVSSHSDAPKPHQP